MSDGPSDSQLIARCQAGDKSAWGALIKKHQNLVYMVAVRSGLNSDDAADIAQKTFIQLYSSLNRLQNLDSLPKWLAVVSARESVRAKKSRWESFESLDEMVVAQEKSVEVQAIESLEIDAISKALDSLEDRCRVLLSELYRNQTDYQTVSKLLGMPLGAVGPTRARCLKKLLAAAKGYGLVDAGDVSSAMEGASRK